MENPCLTFATPSLLSGDKSNADVIAHEVRNLNTIFNDKLLNIFEHLFSRLLIPGPEIL